MEKKKDTYILEEMVGTSETGFQFIKTEMKVLRNDDLENYYNSYSDRIELDFDVHVENPIIQTKSIFCSGKIHTNCNIATRGILYAKKGIYAGRDIQSGQLIYSGGDIQSRGNVIGSLSVISRGNIVCRGYLYTLDVVSKGSLTADQLIANVVEVWGMPCKYYYQVTAAVLFAVTDTHVMVFDTLKTKEEWRKVSNVDELLDIANVSEEISKHDIHGLPDYFKNTRENVWRIFCDLISE